MITARLVLQLTDPAAQDVAVTGGKGAGLARLVQRGLPVPPGFVVVADAYRAHAGAVHDAEPSALRDAILGQPLAAELAAEVVAAARPLLAHGPVAVRSSATLEDLPGAAFAGQHDTFLGLATEAEVLDGVRRCFASLWHDRAVAYRRDRGLGGARPAMAVVVQAMVPADVAGVAFTMCPLSGALDRIVVNAAPGLGETVVAGEEPVDELVLDKATGAILEQRIGEKTHALALAEGGTARVALDPARARACSLDAVDAARLARLCAEVEAQAGFPQDIEWAIAKRGRPKGSSAGSHSDPGSSAEPRNPRGGRASEIASEAGRRAPRPAAADHHSWRRGVQAEVTQGGRASEIADGELLLLQARPVTTFPARWTREESAERFPGVVTPLTWDFIREGFHESLAASLALLGMPPFSGRWFERFDGYVYGNQTAVELYLGLGGAPLGSLDELRGRLPALVPLYRRVAALPHAWARDLDGYLGRLGALSTVRLEVQDEPALLEHVLAVDALGRGFFRPNIAISIMHARLHALLRRVLDLVAGADGPALYGALTSLGETRTALVNRDLDALALHLRAAPELARGDARALVLGGALERAPAFAAALARFLADHGHRELDVDPYHGSWSDRPWVVLDALRLRLGRLEGSPAHEREDDLRARQLEAERRLHDLVPADLRLFASELLRLARAYTALDDLEHYQTTRLAVPFRAGLLELGRRLVSRGALDLPDDVFFLRRAALEDVVHGRRSAVDTLALARAGKEEDARARARGPAWTPGQPAEPAAAPGDLQGTPGSPGAAEGRVRIVRSVDDFGRFEPGAVLVARTTNPAWTPLFHGACAVVTESGGPLSHGAVTARELGLPAVMSVRNALDLLCDGDLVRVNGTTGAVMRLS